MIDFEKFGWTPSDESQNEVDEQVQEEETVAEEEVPAVEEEHEEYQPVSQKKPGKANIVVVGVGGGGNNAVNNMIRAGVKSASFVVMNMICKRSICLSSHRIARFNSVQT